MNCAMKRIMCVFAVVAAINIVMFLVFTDYYVFYSTSNHNRAIDTVLEEWSEQLQSQGHVKFDFDMHVKYRLQILQAEMSRLRKNEKCQSVMDYPSSFWRSQLSQSTNFTAEIDLQRLIVADKCTIIPLAEFIKTPPKPSLYSFEVPYVEEPPVTNILRVSNESTSSVILVNSSSRFYIGDTVALLITMRDGEGNTKSKGGDEIRVWFTDISDASSVLPAKITDMDNGTYLATAILPFLGKFRTTVTLVYSREYIQTAVIAHLHIKSTTIYIAAFSNSNANETTVCSHVPVIPGITDPSEICNVTEMNGTPWFCGRPVKPWLQCTDYAENRLLPLFLTLPMNEAEKELMTRENKIRPITGSSNIKIQVLARENNTDVTQLVSTRACNTVSAKQTWEQSNPTGYLHKGTWHSYLCGLSEKVTQNCLPDLQMLFLGDSNARGHFNAISKISSCEQQIIQQYKAWHKPLHCINKKINFHIKWLPHSNPFKSNEKQWSSLKWIMASNKVIDSIPSYGTHFILINHYLHVTSSHISAYVDMMTAIKESLVRLLRRNRRVLIVLQGPHIVWWFGSRSAYHMGDTLTRFYIAVHYEVFKDLRDHMFYVQTSDMTIATQNSQAHPRMTRQITNIVTGFLCGRTHL